VREIRTLRSTRRGNGNHLTVRLLRHSQRKRRETDRPHLRRLAPFLDPTFRESGGNVGIMRSPVRATALPGASGNVAMAELRTHFATERVRVVALRLKQTRPSSIPTKTPQ
jgi:hypothetical protein